MKHQDDITTTNALLLSTSQATRGSSSSSKSASGVPLSPPKRMSYDYQVRIRPWIVLWIAIGSTVVPYLLGQWLFIRYHHRTEIQKPYCRLLLVLLGATSRFATTHTPFCLSSWTSHSFWPPSSSSSSLVVVGSEPDEYFHVNNHHHQWNYRNYYHHHHMLPGNKEEENVQNEKILETPFTSSQSIHQEDLHHGHSSTFQHLGQHLMIDLMIMDCVDTTTTTTTTSNNNSSTDLLTSQEHLVTALTRLAEQSSMLLLLLQPLGTNVTNRTTTNTTSLLSYHCHEGQLEMNQTAGWTCVAILPGSLHVYLHTFPTVHWLTLDLYWRHRSTTTNTHGDDPLVAAALPQLVPRIRDIFIGPGATTVAASTVPVSNPVPPPHLVWSYKRRGWRGYNDQVDPPHQQYDSKPVQTNDYHQVLGYTFYEKIPVLQEATAWQNVQIIDILSTQVEQGTMDRLLYLDGVLQSRRYGERAYHEALVHPAMFAHVNPKRVAILGGGEGAVLREVLQHKTVEQVVMIEIDERLVEIAQQHLPEWNDCSRLQSGSITIASSCFHDPRAKIVFTDAILWFMNHFGNETSLSSPPSVEPFDVIIVDALDPESGVEFSDLIYRNANLTAAFARALSDQGILVAQTGEAISGLDDAAIPRQDANNNNNNPVQDFIQSLVGAGFESIFEYTESHGRFMAPWTFALALKDRDTRSQWFQSEAHLSLAMQKRSFLNDSNELPFRFFDGATFMNYQFPNRISEETWCRNHQERCDDGHGFDPSLPDRSESSYRVGRSIAANGGRGVFATEKISKGSYLGNEECVSGLFVPPNTFEILEDFASENSYATSFWTTVFVGYVQGYGWEDEYYGNIAAGIETSPLTFVNHGCNKTYNIGDATDVSELTMDLNMLKIRGNYDPFFGEYNNIDPYHPFTERHFPAWGCPRFKALRDIEAGEEVLDNYLVMGGTDREELYNYVAELKSMCSGGIGSVTQYEREREKETAPTP